jgi:hypothetical protein
MILVIFIKFDNYFIININIRNNNCYHKLFGGLNRYKSVLNISAATIIKIKFN